MSNDIGYGAAAIRAGDVKYQQRIVDLLKEAAKPAEDVKPAKPSDPAVGRNLDVKA
jgi:hypothetical protein